MAVPAKSILDMGSNKIINLPDGTSSNDAVNFSQLQGLLDSAVFKKRVRAATTANITLSGAQTVDGVGLIAGERCLVKDQSTASQNGIYSVEAGAWNRVADADGGSEFNDGQAILVSEGTLNSNSFWVLTTNSTIVVGTTSLTYKRVGRASQATPGVYGSASSVPVATLNEDGTVSGFVNTAIVIPASAISSLTDNQILFGQSGGIGQSANLIWSGGRLRSMASGSDSHSLSGCAASFDGGFIAIGDQSADRTFTNGIGIKFHDGGVNHYGIKYDSSINELQFGVTSGSEGLNFDTGTLAMRIGSNKVSIGGPAEATSGLAYPLTVYARSSGYAIYANQSSLAHGGILTNGFFSEKVGTITSTPINTSNALFQNGITFNNPGGVSSSFFGANIQAEYIQTPGVTTQNYVGGISSSVVLQNDIYYGHAARFDMYQRGAATGYTQSYGLYVRFDNESTNSGSDRTMTGFRIDLNKQPATTNLKDHASGLSLGIGSFDNEKLWQSVLGLGLNASHGLETVGARIYAIQGSGIGSGFGSNTLTGIETGVQNNSSAQTVIHGTGITINTSGNFTGTVMGADIAVTSPVASFGYGLRLAVPSGWSANANHYAFFCGSDVKSYLAGQLGIGTSVPTTGVKLEVNGNAILGYGLYSNVYSEMTIGHKDVSPFADKFALTQNSSAQTVFNGSDLFFRLLNVTKMTLKGSSGFFGIDTGDPQRLLHVNGSMRIGATVGTPTKLIGLDANGDLGELGLSGLTITAGVLTVTGGGGGTPAGSNTQIQFNDSGAFGADALFSFIKGAQPKFGVGIAAPIAAVHAKSWNSAGALTLLTEDSAGNDIFTVLSNGYLKLGNNETHPRIYQSATVGGAVSYVAGCINLDGLLDTAGSSLAAAGVCWQYGTVTSGDMIGFTVKGATFAPTTGTATLASIGITQVINQSGSSSGITRGIWINPVLTNAVDYRAIELTNASGKGLWQTGASVLSSFAGNVGFGGQTSAAYPIDAGISTGGARIPNGTTGQQPAHAAGVMRYNSTTGRYEGSNGSVWLSFSILSGSGVSGRVSYWNGTDSFTSSADLQFNGTEFSVGGAPVSGYKIFAAGPIRVGATIESRGVGNSFASDLGTSALRLINTTAVTGDSWIWGSKNDGGFALVSGNQGTVLTVSPTTGLFAPTYAFGLTGVVDPTTLAANQNNYDIGDAGAASVARLSASASVDITGIAGGAPGRFLYLTNISAFDITLRNNSGSSTAANRFDIGQDFLMSAGLSVILWYDSTSSRWRAFGAWQVAGGGGGGAPTNAQYLTLATNGSLTDERVATAGANLKIVDGGAGGAATISALSESVVLPGVISPAQITSDQNDYAPTDFATAFTIRIDGDSNIRAINGLAGGASGRRVTFRNVGSFPIVFPGEHTASTAANRFRLSEDFILYPNHAVEFMYDGSFSRWMLASSTTQIAPVGTFNYYLAPGSITTADYGYVTFTVAGSGTLSASVAAAGIPAYFALSTTSAATNGYAMSFSKTVGGPVFAGDAHMEVSTLLEILILSDATNTYSVALELTNTSGSLIGTLNNSVALRYTHGTNSGKWQLVSRDNAGAESVADTGITVVVSTKYRLSLVLNKARTETRAYINGACVGVVTGNMPNAVGTAPRVKLIKSVGTSARAIRVFSMQSRITTSF